ncbi:MAG TPA: hypothetical protein PLO20_16065, partial [Thermogutta sp.]|nr:hypothetical protein [Thermogutta sp.]
GKEYGGASVNAANIGAIGLFGSFCLSRTKTHRLFSYLTNVISGTSFIKGVRCSAWHVSRAE